MTRDKEQFRKKLYPDMEKELTEDEKKAQKYIVEQVINAIDLLEKHFKKYCDEVAPAYTGAKSTAVPMVYISESVNRFKESYRKGAEGDGEIQS